MKKMLRVAMLSSYALLLLPENQASADAHPLTVVIDENQVYARIPAGSYMMGTTALREAVAEMPEPDPSMIWDEAPQHKVIFDRDFYIGTTEVTQKQWLDIMNTRPGPDSHWNHADWEKLPVTGVSWHDVQSFIAELNAKSDIYEYRLPTEAEWEYAARANTTGLRPFPLDELDQHAWYIKTSNDEIQPVATKQANAWGLHDMLGNAWEWVADWYSPQTYRNSRTENPQGPEQGTKKIRRGGSYHCPAHLVRPGYRSADTPDKAYSVLGFRLIIEARQARFSETLSSH